MTCCHAHGQDQHCRHALIGSSCGEVCRRSSCSQAAQALDVVTSQQQPAVVVAQRMVQYREEVR